MDPVRRVLLLLLLTSVVMTEPTQTRALGPEREGRSPTTPAQWIQQLAVAIRQTVKPAAITPPGWHQFKAAPAAPTTLEAQVAAAHPAREPHAFRLPPPTDEG